MHDETHSRPLAFGIGSKDRRGTSAWAAGRPSTLTAAEGRGRSTNFSLHSDKLKLVLPAADPSSGCGRSICPRHRAHGRDSFALSMTVVAFWLFLLVVPVGSAPLGELGVVQQDPLLGPKTAVPLLLVQPSESDLVLQAGERPGQFHSQQPITVEVGSMLPYWEVQVGAEPFRGPGGAVIPPEHVKIQMQSAAGSYRRRGSGGSMQDLKDPVLLAQGEATASRLVEANAFQVSVQTDPYLPPGTYHGKLLLVGDDTRTSLSSSGMRKPRKPPKNKPSGEIKLSLEIEEYINVCLDTQELEFGVAASVPGINEARNCVLLTVQSNVPDLVFTAQLRDLVREEEMGSEARAKAAMEGQPITIPHNAVCLAWGKDIDESRRNLKKTDFGVDLLQVRPGKAGEHRYYLSGRLNITSSMPAGNYRGFLEVQVHREGGD